MTIDEKRKGILILILVTGMALLQALGIISVMPFLAVMSDPAMLETNQILKNIYSKLNVVGVNDPGDFLILLGVTSFLMILISAIYQTVTDYVLNNYVEGCRTSISVRLLEHYLSQPYSFFLENHSGDLSKNILSEVDQVVGNVFRPVSGMIAYGIVAIAIALLLIIVDPLLTLLVFSFIVFLYLLVYFILRNKLVLLGKDRVLGNKSRFKIATELFGGIKIVKLSRYEKTYIDKFKRASKKFTHTQAIYQTLNKAPHYFVESIVFGSVILLCIWLLMKSGGLVDGILADIIPILGVYALSVYRMKPALQKVYVGVTSLRYGSVAVDSLFVEMQTNKFCDKHIIEGSETVPVEKDITVESVYYSYPKSDIQILTDVNVNIPFGTSLGIVGATGSGKTTLVDIIVGLLTPTKGAVKIGGVEITDNNRFEWQRNVGYVPQDIFLTDGSVSENIAYGIDKENINIEQVERSAKLAQIHNFVTKEMINGYGTLVGERGVRLSGGQRQRIGIGRALYFDPSVVVFDEATSALDVATEELVMRAIENIGNKKTVILIAHRLNTVKNCDHIVMMEKGRISRQGNASELGLI